jgi:hypothetical protein
MEKIWTKEDVEGAAQDLHEAAEQLKLSRFVDVKELIKKLENARAALLDYSVVLD